MSDGSSGPDAGASLIDFGPSGLRGPTEKAGPRFGVVRGPPPGHHDGGQVEQLYAAGPQQLDVVRTEEVSGRDQNPSSTARQDVRRLRAFEAGVHRDEHPPGQGTAEHGHHPLDAVESPDGHPVTGFHADRHQCRTEGAGFFEELGKAQPTGAILYGQFPPEALRSRVEHGRDARPRAPVTHRAATSATFIRRARFPPMILRTDSSSTPASSST